ncbi:hypothetical protein [Natrialba swarupiae]|uniref:Uncharacterized protein n=1 Tax=Natrialba swarupiae TaxID=2448032 RepID=A0A5D5AK13_9EURY|nr:hypothetical protein [Natrialba swarupiae]TYT62026.1 hypothetical protein FYC77_10000 [Natrialba swarupiae]
MPTPPTPYDDVPNFIVDRFDDHSKDELRAIATYAETLDGSLDVPDYIVQAFAIQDEETRTVVAIYANELATYLEELEDQADDDDEDEDFSPGRMGGAFFG